MKYCIWVGIFFILIHIAIVYLLPSAIPAAHFPYEDYLLKYFSFYQFTHFANFDGYQYISIAKIGYAQLQQSYFPLFPMLIAAIAPLFLKNYVLTGMCISVLCFFLGIYYFKKYSDILLSNRKQTLWVMIFLLAFPTAFFFQMIYPESLFLFVSTASLYFLIKKKYVTATIFVFFASLTKIQGVLLVIPFFLSICQLDLFAYKKLTLRSIGKFLTKKSKAFFFAFAPIYGLLAYSLYLYIQYKDPFYYYHAQSAFGAHRSTNTLVLLPQVLYRYIKIFYTSQMNFSYWVAWFEFVIFLLVAGVLVYDLIRICKDKQKDMHQLSLNIYSLAVMLLPTLTGTLTSYPRYALLSLGFFTTLAKIQSNLIKISIISIFAIVQVIVYIYFLKGYFVS